MTTSSPASHNSRWRPDGDGPVCGHTFRGVTCEQSGPHYCRPRADRVVAFFARMLVHTKGPLQRTPFVLRSWQEHEIIRPLFGEVVWSAEWGRYVRRYRIAYIVLARKNGKSALVAGIVLYLLVGDDEEEAEVYGAAKDTKQAGKVFQPVDRMRQLSPKLNGDRGHQGRLKHNKNSRRIFDERTASYYEVITSDAEGELGHNPHGFVLDEVLSQPDDSLWTAMVTSQGARVQPLYLAITTETSEQVSFGADLIDEAERVEEDPPRAPHVFTFVRKTPHTDVELERVRRLHPDHPDLPVSTDWRDEANWKWPNPGLDEFKSRESMRQQLLDATNEPKKEAAFRQFQLNQRVQSYARYIALDLWDANSRETFPNPDWLAERLEGRCWGGLDLSSKLDLTSWTLLFDDGRVWWRLWAPEAVVPLLDGHTDGAFSRWADAGWVTVTEGDTIDYDSVYAGIAEDTERWSVESVAYDRWSGEPARQEIEKRTDLLMVESDTTYARMTAPMQEFSRLLHDKAYEFGRHPVARWMAEALDAKSPRDDPDRIRPVKPDRRATGKRIDGMVTLIYATGQRMLGAQKPADLEPFAIRA